MASFIHRAIDPDLWQRLEAKAVAEEITVRTLILKALAQYVALLQLVLVSTACAYQNPAAATPIAPPAAVPASITLTSVSEVGATAGQVDVAAAVKDATGKGIGGAVVHFTTTAGTLLLTTVTADGGGLAQASLTTTGPATITASSGSVSAHLDVVPTSAPPPPPAATPPVLNPGPPPVTFPPSVPPPPPAPPSISLAPITTTVGVSATFQAATVLNGVSAVSYRWDFGDGTAPTTTTTATTQHAYLASGTKTASVTVTDALGRSAAASAVVVVGEPVLAATLGCIPGKGDASTPTACNVAATYGGAPLNSSGIGVEFDWGDGTAVESVTSQGSHRYRQPGKYLVAVLVHATPNATVGPLTATASASVTVP